MRLVRPASQLPLRKRTFRAGSSYAKVPVASCDEARPLYPHEIAARPRCGHCVDGDAVLQSGADFVGEGDELRSSWHLERATNESGGAWAIGPPPIRLINRAGLPPRTGTVARATQPHLHA